MFNVISPIALNIQPLVESGNYMQNQIIQISGQVVNIQNLTGSYVTTGNNQYSKIQRTKVITNSAGIYNYVYPFSYLSGTNPIVHASMEVDSTDVWDIKLTYVNHTGCGILTQKASAVNILGINVVALPAGASGIVNITVVSP